MKEGRQTETMTGVDGSNPRLRTHTHKKRVHTKMSTAVCFEVERLATRKRPNPICFGARETSLKYLQYPPQVRCLMFAIKKKGKLLLGAFPAEVVLCFGHGQPGSGGVSARVLLLYDAERLVTALCCRKQTDA